MIPESTPLSIGALAFAGMDQIDLTGPFEVLSRLPNCTYRIYAKTGAPIRDLNGLRLIPDGPIAEAPQLDVLHVPGGFGQEALVEDQEVLAWIQKQAAGSRYIFSVCTGALLCGAAGLLRGRRATTHWSSLHLLPLFGAIPVNERVVVDSNTIFAAGVTAGIDGALRLAAELRGEETAQAIQLNMAYAPEPPFDSGATGAGAAGDSGTRPGVVSDDYRATRGNGAPDLGPSRDFSRLADGVKRGINGDPAKRVVFIVPLRTAAV